MKHDKSEMSLFFHIRQTKLLLCRQSILYIMWWNLKLDRNGRLVISGLTNYRQEATRSHKFWQKLIKIVKIEKKKGSIFIFFIFKCCVCIKCVFVYFKILLCVKIGLTGKIEENRHIYKNNSNLYALWSHLAAFA
jgi:hypothetical protein